ncbi:MAG: SusD/RagB family nutrient-binding outer membrane lipoprotein [Sphingobacteriaceae bacterium]
MKSTIYKIILCGVVLMSSCKKGNDLYDNPDAPAKISPGLALTSVQVNTFMNSEGDFARVSSVFTQQMAGAIDYSTLQNYQLTAGDYNNHWNGLYSGTMFNAKLMIDTYSENNPYYAGMAKVLMALNLSIAADFFGDVPYAEAFKGDEKLFTSKYDKQEDVYLAIQTLLDNAIVDFQKPESANEVVPADDDVIFNGNIGKWITASWTLKARFANRLSLKDPQGSATKVLEYLGKGIKTSDDNMENVHNDVSPNQWGDFQSLRLGSLLANKKFIDVLLSNQDPRMSYYFLPDTTGNYVGADINAEQVNSDASVVGSYFDSKRNYGLVTFHEAKFLEAEAKFRLGQDASNALNDGIKASVDYVTRGTNDGTSIATYTAGTADLTSIMTEKWKAMFGHIEAYNDFRRTGLPVLTPRPQSAGAILNYIPKRLPTPTTESDSNPNAVFVPLDKPVWWATN